jgi:class 3 adenylate cyclase
VSAPGAAAPSGVVTFLFTDVEGSTRRWEKDADAMRAALAAHDEVLRRVIEAHAGWLFKHTGDGVCVPRSPRRPLTCAPFSIGWTVPTSSSSWASLVQHR